VLHLDGDRTCLDHQGGGDAEFGSLSLRVDVCVCVCLVHEPEARVLGELTVGLGRLAPEVRIDPEKSTGAMLSWLHTEMAGLLPIRRFSRCRW